VEDGEQLFLGGKRNEEGECEKQAEHSDPKVANSAKMSEVTDRQETQVSPLLKREGDVSPE